MSMISTKQGQKKIKLPLITTKTNEQASKQRPLSQKKEQLTEIQRNLFSKLQALDSKDGKQQKKRKPSAESCKQIVGNMDDMPAFNRLEKLAPQLYTRLVKIQKGEYSFNSVSLQDQKDKPIQSKRKNLKPELITSHNRSTEETHFLTDYPSNEIEHKESEQIMDHEMERIYTEYLQKEGLQRETTSKDLKQINDEFSSTEVSVEHMTQSLKELLEQAQDFVSSYIQ